MTNCIYSNGRSADSHGALFYFHSSFTRIDPPSTSEKDYEKKMHTSVVGEFNRAQREMGGNKMGASTFRRHLKEHFPRVGLCPHKQDYCDTCKVLETDLSRCRFIIRKITGSGNSSKETLLPHETELATLTKTRQNHLSEAKLARKFYNDMVTRCKEQWSRLSTSEGATSSNLHSFTLVLSADYQQAKLVPHWGRSAQPASTYYLMMESHDIFRIVDHRDESGHVRIFSEKVGPKNTDHTVSLLKSYIKDVKHPWGERVIIFLDNATSTNKNRYLFGWAMEEVKRGLVQSIHFYFLVAGHTKFAPDRLFASCSQSYNTADVFNTKELKGIYAKHCRTVAICNEALIHPWRSYLADCYTDLPGVRKLLKFLIVQGEGDKVIFRVGESCYSPQMERSPMRKTSNADMDVDVQDMKYTNWQKRKWRT